MPQFHFDIIDTGLFERDEHGLELPSTGAARKQAVSTLAGIAREELPDGDFREFVIRVRDGQGEKPVLTASLTMKVEWRDGEMTLLPIPRAGE